ncbi:MAG TPA: hypothetical protein VKB17_10380 [Thermoleophilaceae bacterium]|nr:hypothetical protein [Thermoleophilaceae bacterium]
MKRVANRVFKVIAVLLSLYLAVVIAVFVVAAVTGVIDAVSGSNDDSGQPAIHTTTPPSKPKRECDPNYEGACLKPDVLDYDCGTGEGDGPYYVDPGTVVTVVGEDIYGLDPVMATATAASTRFVHNSGKPDPLGTSRPQRRQGRDGLTIGTRLVPALPRGPGA